MRIESNWNKIWKIDRRNKAFFRVMGLLNLLFAAANIFFWSALALVIADPIGWATWSTLGSVSSRPDLFEYPFVMLWGLPLLGSGVAAINNFLGLKQLARVAALSPLLLFGTTLVWWSLFRHLS